MQLGVFLVLLSVFSWSDNNLRKCKVVPIAFKLHRMAARFTPDCYRKLVGNRVAGRVPSASQALRSDDFPIKIEPKPDKSTKISVHLRGEPTHLFLLLSSQAQYGWVELFKAIARHRYWRLLHAMEL